MRCSSAAIRIVDNDFYEWAVGEAEGADAPSVGT